MRDELRRLRSGGVRESEVRAARAFLEGQERFRRETARQWADLLAEAAFTGLPVDAEDWGARRWRGLAAADLERVIRRWLDPRQLAVTIGLPG